ncbi:MAG: fumarylacetoacetate hydrolase family protein [Actinomycetota bacterium]
MTNAVRYRTGSGEARLGRLDGDTITDAGPAPEAGFVPTAENWALIRDAAGATCAAADVQLLHPVVPREETRPDWEAELAVVIGTRCYRATKANALDHVGGYTAINDVSGRRAQLETPLRQFVYGKSFDTFAPLGPSIASVDGVDLADIRVSSRIGDEVLQDSNTRNLIFSVADIIEYVSRGTTLEPGDVIATGTPGGVGDGRDPKRYLQDGEVIEVEVAGVGTLSNPVRHEA